MNAKQTALDTYLARNAAIQVKLGRLQRLADDGAIGSPSSSLQLEVIVRRLNTRYTVSS